MDISNTSCTAASEAHKLFALSEFILCFAYFAGMTCSKAVGAPANLLLRHNVQQTFFLGFLMRGKISEGESFEKHPHTKVKTNSLFKIFTMYVGLVLYFVTIQTQNTKPILDQHCTDSKHVATLISTIGRMETLIHNQRLPSLVKLDAMIQIMLQC